MLQRGAWHTVIFSTTQYVTLQTRKCLIMSEAAIMWEIVNGYNLYAKWIPTHTHTHTRLMAPCPGLPRWAGTRKVKPIWILLKQETVSGSGISWAICKSAHRSRQITTPAPHRSVFYRPDALPAAQPTVSKHWRQWHSLQKQVVAATRLLPSPKWPLKLQGMSVLPVPVLTAYFDFLHPVSWEEMHV